MSAKIKGIAEIELKSDRFTQPAAKAKTALTELGTKGKTALQDIGKGADKAKGSLTQLGTKGKQSIEKIGQGADRAKGPLSQLGTQGKQSIEKITTGADRAKQSMSTMASSASTSMGQVGRSATLAGSQVTQSAARGSAAYNQLGISGQRAGSQISTGMVQAAASTTQMTAATQQANVSMGVMTLGIAALGTSIGTTFTGMSNLNKAHLKQDKAIQKVAKVTVGLARANDLLSSTQLAVERFTLSIASMEAKGLQATDAYTISKKNLALQLQKLGTAQDDYAVKLADIQIAENDALQVADDLQDTYINMTISISNTALMSAFLAKTMMPNLTIALIKVRIGLILARFQFRDLSRQILFTIFNLNKFKIAMIGATLSLRGMAIGVRSFMLALGPLGIAMIAIGAAFAIWETNAFGVRDAIKELWNWLKVIMPVLGALELLIKNVFPPAEEAVSEFGEAADESATKLEEFGETALVTGSDLRTGLIPNLSNLKDGFDDVTIGATAAGKAVDEFKKKQESFSKLRVFADLSKQEQDAVLFGRDGVFIRTGRNLVGFRGDPFAITRQGTESAIKNAMQKLGVSRAIAIELTKTTQWVRSRVLSDVRTLGGQVTKAIFAFLGERAGSTGTAGFQIPNLGFAEGRPGGRGPPSSIAFRIRIQDAQITRLATGGRLLPGKSIGQPGAVVGGFSTRQGQRAAGKKRALRRATQLRRLFPDIRLGTSRTNILSRSGQIISQINQKFASIGVTFDMLAGGRISLVEANRRLVELNEAIAKHQQTITELAPLFGFEPDRISTLFPFTKTADREGLFQQLQALRGAEFFARPGIIRTGAVGVAESMFGLPLEEILRNDTMLRDLNNMLRFANHERYAVITT